MAVPPDLLAAALTVGAALLAAPVSSGLARARWTARSPVPALLLWQAICLSAGVAVVGAGVVLALAPLGADPGSAVAAWARNVLAGRPTAGLSARGVVAGLIAAAFAAGLLAVLIRTAVQGARRRRGHRDLLDLLTNSGTDRLGRPPDVRLLDSGGRVAYTVPGWHARIVVSVGLFDVLDDDELAAVVAHERAHLTFRHELLVLPFRSWAAALGVVPGVRAAAASVGELVEMQADDVAARRTSCRVLVRALALVALSGSTPGRDGGTEPHGVGARPGVHARLGVDVPPGGTAGGAGRTAPGSGATGALTTAVVRRVDRLTHPRPLPRPAAAAVLLLAAGLLIAPVAALLLAWP